MAATRQGALIPAIKIPGTVEDRAVLSALESIQSTIEALKARDTHHFVKIPFTGDIRTLAETVVFNPTTNVELTDASFIPDTTGSATVIMTLYRRNQKGEGQSVVGRIDGRVSGFTRWVQFLAKDFVVSSSRKLSAGEHHTFQCAPNGAVAPLHGTLVLAYREVL